MENHLELSKQDLARAVLRLPKDVQELLKKYPVFVAGGFLRSVVTGEKVTDVDIFGPTKELLHRLAMTLALARHGRVHETENAFTILSSGQTPVQFIYRWLFERPEDLVNSFDYTIARAAVWWTGEKEGEGKWVSFCTESFYKDLAARRLVYTSPIRNEDAGGSLLRMRKFLARGYSIEVESIAAVVSRLMMGVDVERFGDLSPGREEWLTKVLTGLLREVDPLSPIEI